MQIDVSFIQMEVYECGAKLLALLACPAESEEAKRKELYLSLCGRALWFRYLARRYFMWVNWPERLRR